MFTGIVQGIATVAQLQDRKGLRSFTLNLPPGFCEGLAIGASVSVDGVCLTVTALRGGDAADFDVMQQSLALTTLADLREGNRINVERAARDGAEIGGHPLSGHIDFRASVAQIRRPENNCVLRSISMLIAAPSALSPKVVMRSVSGLSQTSNQPAPPLSRCASATVRLAPLTAM